MYWFHSRTFLYRLGGTLWVLVLLPAILVTCGSQRTEEPAASVPAATSGSELFEGLGCIQCHQIDGGGLGPSLVGLYGETIPLETGKTVTVDDQFIRTSILDPRAHTHAGYPPVMPPYEGRIGEEEMSMLVAYIRSLEE